MSFVIRTWCRDGMTNRMTLEAAVENLALNGRDYQPPSISPLVQASRKVEINQRLLKGEVLTTPNAFFRHASAIMTMLLVAFAIMFLVSPTSAQWKPIEYYWTTVSSREIALWHNGIQIGGMYVDTLEYYPRLSPGEWGEPCESPVPPPDCFTANRQPSPASELRREWRSQGVISSDGTPGSIPNRGLRINGNPIATIKGVTSNIPSFDTMASLTFVAKDGLVADNAASAFNTLPEFATWRKKYGNRVKSYSLEDFQHTGKAFKLDQDKQFAQTGFVALLQDAPDADDKAVVHSIYVFESPTQFLCALRDADPLYDPNPHSPDSGDESEWGSGHATLATVLIAATGAIAVGSWMAFRRKNQPQAR